PKLGFMGPYTMVNWRDPKEMIRYWGQKQRVGGGWFGDYARGNYGSLYDNIGSAKLYDSVTRFEPWNMLLHGYNSAMWFSMARPFVCHQPLPYYQSAKDEISEIKHGMSKLLLNADRLDDRIAVYYDLSCLWANEISGGQRYGKIVNDMMAVLEHCHLQYGMISAADLGDVTTLRKKYDLLILPSVRPLDDTQVKILREFIAQGGRIIADTMPGIMDEHGDIREKSPLTDLFSGTSCRIIEANWGRDGQEYTASLSREKRETMVNVMSLTLSDLGVNPPIKLEPNLQRVEVVRFALGDQEFVSLLPEIDAVDGESRECRLTLPHKGHVYDVRARKYMGELQEIPVTIRPARAMVFAILPSRPKEISVKTDIASARQGRIVSLEVAVRDADGKQRSRAIRAALVDPSGKDRPELSRNLFLPNGNLKTDLYLPLSEPSGEWSLRLQDVVSGLSREIKITVPSL
ncbi:MAG: beta-galactosidase trimerization domain-containing protein, partial [Lentisphaerota bacterium]